MNLKRGIGLRHDNWVSFLGIEDVKCWNVEDSEMVNCSVQGDLHYGHWSRGESPFKCLSKKENFFLSKDSKSDKILAVGLKWLLELYIGLYWS